VIKITNRVIRNLDNSAWKTYKEICAKNNIKPRIDLEQKFLDFMASYMIENIPRDKKYNDPKHIKLPTLSDELWIKITNFAKIQGISIGYMTSLMLDQFILSYQDRILKNEPVSDLFVAKKIKYEVVNNLVASPKETESYKRMMRISGFDVNLVNDFLVTCAVKKVISGLIINDMAAHYIIENKDVLIASFGIVQANIMHNRATNYLAKKQTQYFDHD
jgi:hypothetical protein